MTVTLPKSKSGSYLVFTGEDAELSRAVLLLYLQETQWVVSGDAVARGALGDEGTDAILQRRAMCEQALGGACRCGRVKSPEGEWDRYTDPRCEIHGSGR